MSETTPSPEGVARTPTGEIATQTQTTSPSAQTAQTSTTTEQPSLANEVPEPAPAPAPRAPESYTDFAVPIGYELDKEAIAPIKALFKELDLPQADGQKIMDMYTKYAMRAANAPFDAWTETQNNWVKEVRTDKEMGPRLSEIQTTISRAIDGLGDPKLANDFRQAMDFTGAGNNPAFIRAFWKMSQKLVEGAHVSGNGPSPAANGSRRPTTAQAMYPNLPTANS